MTPQYEQHPQEGGREGEEESFPPHSSRRPPPPPLADAPQLLLARCVLALAIDSVVILSAYRFCSFRISLTSW
jgi:hypothetical protein